MFKFVALVARPTESEPTLRSLLEAYVGVAVVDAEHAPSDSHVCACFGFTLVAHTLRSIASLILRTSTQPTPVTLLLSRASSQCGLCGLVGRAADERQAWRQTWTKGATVHSARSSYLCVKRTSPTLALAARLARVPSESLKRRLTSNFSLVFTRLCRLRYVQRG